MTKEKMVQLTHALIKTSLILLLCIILLPTNTNAQKSLDKAKLLVKKFAQAHKLNPQDTESFILTDHHVSSTSEVSHFYFQQTHINIPIHGAHAGVHLDRNGAVVSLNNQFEEKVVNKINNIHPKLNPVNAVKAAARQMKYQYHTKFETLEKRAGSRQTVLLKNTGLSSKDIPVKLIFQPIADGSIRLAWDLSIREIKSPDWWSIRVDAETGEILHKNNWTISCDFGESACSDNNKHASICNHSNRAHHHLSHNNRNVINPDSYNVYPLGVESPNHGNRVLVQDPANLNASPFGWHDTDGVAGAEYTITRGNNVLAREDLDGGDGAGASPDGGANLDFNFPVDLTQAPQTYLDAATTNLFYWNNIMHDVFHQYGFDEASGNFQENNYGNGGAGGDYVIADCQDGGGTNNANFSAPSDGNNGYMQMYLWNGIPDRDGDFDNGIVCHEYGHGVSIRLTGGGGNSGCLNNSEQMGEGWSDWLGLILTIQPGQTGADKRGVGTFALGEPTTGNGIRTYPYSTNTSINPHTYNDIGGAAIPHGVGSVWCAMLWEMTWALIDQYGYDADVYNGTGGNNIAMALVIEGMKLQPCSPGFVDGRDAILAADEALYGGANQCLIWEAFAKRGLGINASQGDSGSTTDGVESYDIPSLGIEKVVDKTTASPGDTLVYTIRITNPPLCGITYTNIVISDDLPANTAYLAGSASDGGTESADIVTFPTVSTIAPNEIIIRNFSVVIDPSVSTAISNINDDVENGNPYWTPNATNAGLSNWQITTTNPYAGANAWFAQDVTSPNEQYLLLTDPILPDQGSQLIFWHSYDTEATWDGGLVQVSTDNRESWSDLGNQIIQNGYNSTIDNNITTPAFSGNSNGYLQTVVDLGSYAGQVISIRFWMHCDAAEGGNGWYIDDISINSLYNFIPNTATATADGGIEASDALDTPTGLVSPSCLDGIPNGDEVDVDCGGSLCPACISCEDGVFNGEETGVDCGGPECPACPTCDDGILNGNETEVDCGGPECPACPTCDDGILNGDETEVDCGGSRCPVCPTCDDGEQNGDETDVDCGGSECPACPCFGSSLTLTITLDNYPEETSWAFIDATASIVASGGTYPTEPDASTLTIPVCLPDGCYDFIFYDSYGDGICCDYGQGSYELLNNEDGMLITNGGQLGTSDTTNFCLTAPVAGCDSLLLLTGTLNTAEYHAGYVIKSNGLIETDSNVVYKAGNNINLNLGFEVKDNAEFLAMIEACGGTTTLVLNTTSTKRRTPQTGILFALDKDSKLATIQYKLKSNSICNLYLQNLQGKVTTIQEDEWKVAGKQKLDFNTQTLPSGVYYLILEKDTEEKLIEKIVIP